MSDVIRRQDALNALNWTWAGETAIQAIKDLPSARQWTPCSEGLPKPRVDVWVCSDIGQIQGYYEEHIDTWYASFGQGRDYLELIVTAWMPLPEPYEEEKKDERI
jgi:hypothetical protein